VGHFKYFNAPTFSDWREYNLKFFWDKIPKYSENQMVSKHNIEANQHDKEQARKFMQLTSDLLCTQIIEHPTRKNSILDLFK